MDLSVIALANKIQTEADAYRLLEELRWNGKPVCPHCGSERAYFLNPKNGKNRKTRTGAVSQRRVWKCGACRKQYSVLTNTIFHGTKVSLRIWLFVIFEMCANKNGLAAREIERKYSLPPKTAWFMTQRIREAMKRDPLAGLLQGTIVADESYFGGDPRNRHRNVPQGPEARFETRNDRKRTVASGRGTDKPIIMTLVHKESGEARSHMISGTDSKTLRSAITKHVDTAGSTLHTDELRGYKSVGSEFKDHQSVNHGLREYVRGDVSTNQAENFFSQFKRSVDGTHHHISEDHLPRYLAEFDYRYSSRKLNDTARMVKLLGQVGGRRLLYRETA